MANSVLDKFRNQVANPTRGCGETYFSVMVTGIVTGVDPLHPADIHMPETNNSTDVFAVLNARGAVNSMSARHRFDLRRGSKSKNARIVITIRALM
jgi:hypothetical protein